MFLPFHLPFNHKKDCNPIQTGIRLIPEMEVLNIRENDTGIFMALTQTICP